MGQLHVYRNFQEKKNFYPVQLIKTKSEVDALFLEFTKKTGKSIWRGMAQSNYKHYTSLQRFWLENDLPADKEKVEKYLRHVYAYAKTWHSDFFEKYFLNYGIAVFSIYSALSILRHHGAPTPLLDWSRNPFIALFFAAHSTVPYPTDQVIENYFSLYEMKEIHPYYMFDTKDITLEFAKLREENLRNENKERAENDPEFIEHFSEAYLNDEQLFFNRIDAAPIFRVQDLPMDKVKYYVNNNYNITNQEGLFIINVAPIEPLEEAILNRAREQAQRIKIPAKEVREAIRKHRDSFLSYDFHKSLKEYVLKKLDDRGINAKYIFPNLKELADGCVNSYLTSEL